jgi:hypothetical protein
MSHSPFSLTGVDVEFFPEEKKRVTGFHKDNLHRPLSLS